MKPCIPLSVIFLTVVSWQILGAESAADTPEGCPVCECPEDVPMGRSFGGGGSGGIAEDAASELWQDGSEDGYQVFRVPSEFMLQMQTYGKSRNRRSLSEYGRHGSFAHGPQGHGRHSHAYQFGHFPQVNPYYGGGYSPYGHHYPGQQYVYPYSKSDYKWFESPFKSGELTSDKEYYQTH